MVGARLDNQMNFGNPPLFPETTDVVCINGSHEEIDFNRAADFTLLSDPGAFLQMLIAAAKAPDFRSNRIWYDLNRQRRAEWVAKMLADLEREASAPEFDGRIHPLQLALAKNVHRDKNVVLISGDGAFLSGGLSIEAAFQENRPITVVIDNNGGLDCISQQQERLFESGSHYATDFRDIPFHSMFEGLGGYGELVTRREDIIPAVQRAIASGKTACVNVKAKGVISPIVLATTSKRDKASIE